MSKRARLAILLVVLAFCYVFLRPSINWYWGTPEDVQTLALSSLENIRDYATRQGQAGVDAINAAVAENADAKIAEEYAYLEKAAVKKYKKAGEKVPSEMTVGAVRAAYANDSELLEDVSAKFRDEILKAKKTYQSSVKLGLDLSGGMNIIVKADLDAALASQGETVAK